VRELALSLVNRVEDRRVVDLEQLRELGIAEIERVADDRPKLVPRVDHCLVSVTREQHTNRPPVLISDLVGNAKRPNLAKA